MDLDNALGSLSQSYNQVQDDSKKRTRQVQYLLMMEKHLTGIRESLEKENTRLKKELKEAEDRARYGLIFGKTLIINGLFKPEIKRKISERLHELGVEYKFYEDKIYSQGRLVVVKGNNEEQKQQILHLFDEELGLETYRVDVNER